MMCQFQQWMEQIDDLPRESIGYGLRSHIRKLLVTYYSYDRLVAPFHNGLSFFGIQRSSTRDEAALCAHIAWSQLAAS